MSDSVEATSTGGAGRKVEVDRTLLADAKRYGVPYMAYADMTVRERGAVKARWVKAMKAEAGRREIDPEEFLAMSDEAREEARKKFPEKERPAPRRRRYSEDEPSPRSFEEVMARHPETTDEEPPSAPRRAPVAELYDEGLTDGEDDDAPETEDDPKMRTTPTLGEVHRVDDDLAGWSSPKNLRDVYARYSIGDGQHFIRVERIDPKVWQQVPCAGYLGEIREAITEPEFHAFYGGRVYSLTVYGPDPKGRRDPSTGLPVIKAKTEPFRYTVPLLPPNLTVLPGINPRKQQGETTMHPFMPQMGTPPVTQADAAMHRTNIDFMSDLLKRSDRERDELRAQVANGGGAKEAIAAVTETNKVAIEAANRAAEAREKSLTEQLENERSERRRLEQKIDKLTEQQQNGRGDPVEGAARLMEVANPGKNAEEQVTRLRESHREEVTRLREQNKEALVSLKERHDDELKRARDRLDDVEKHYREKLAELESRSREREKELRDQSEQMRRDEREAADRRVRETVDRFEERIKDQRSQHERELRMQEGQHVTRSDTTKSTWEMQLANAKERVKKLEDELAEAREEIEESKDPVKVMEKAKASAEALGFKKDENEPQTAWERFAATAGMGLGKALESVDTWLPKALEARSAAVAAGPPQGGRMLPPGAQQPPPQQRQVQRPAPQRRGVAWATQGAVPVAGQQPTMPAQQAPAPQQPIVAPPSAAAPVEAPPVQVAPQESAPPPAAIEVSPQQEQEPTQEMQPNGAPNGAANAQYGAVFPDEMVVQFRAEIERAISAGMPADEFGRRLFTAYPEPSFMLVRAHKSEDFLEIIKKMPAGQGSVILRRDGKRWVEKLWSDLQQRHMAAAAAQQQPS